MTDPELIKLQCAKSEAGFLLRELSSNRLDVTLVEGTNGKKIRNVEGRNPGWYRDIFKTNSSGKGKRSRSTFRRCRVIPILEKLSKGHYRNSSNTRIIMDIIRDRLFNGYYSEEFGIYVPAQL